VTVAGTASATVAGAIVQHEAASSEAAFAGASMAHAAQAGVASPFDDIGIGQTSRSPARGAAPVATRESKRRRLAVRRIMILE
jgi:purine nucleoside permease